MQMSLYIPGNSFLHRCDPRVKLLLSLFFVVYLFLPYDLAYQLIECVFLVIVTGRVLGLKRILNPLRSIYPILIMIAVLTPPFYQGNAFEVTAMLILRFTGITYAFYLLFSVTEMNSLIQSLRWFGLPYQASLVITMAMRFIPYLGHVYQQVRDAHRLRLGADEVRRGPVRRLRALIPVLTSVMIYAIKAIPMLSMSLEHRGLGYLAAVGSDQRRVEVKRLRCTRTLFTHLFFSVMIAVIFVGLPQVVLLAQQLQERYCL